MNRNRTHEPTAWDLLFPGAYLTSRLNHLEIVMSDMEARLNEAISQVGTDLGEAIDRIEAKLADADINLDDEISTLRGFSDRLDGIATDPAPEPDPNEPVDPNEPIDPNQP